MNALSDWNSRQLYEYNTSLPFLSFIIYRAQTSNPFSMLTASEVFFVSLSLVSPHPLGNKFLLFPFENRNNSSKHKERKKVSAGRGENQSPVKIVWLHVCPFHSAFASKAGPAGWGGPGALLTERLSLQAERGLPSELNRKMTKRWQKWLPVPSRSATSENALSFRRAFSLWASSPLGGFCESWRLDARPIAQAPSGSWSARLLSWKEPWQWKAES